MTIAVIYGGTRQESNTELLTERAISGLETERIYLRDYDIKSIEDHRHSEGGFPHVDDDYNDLLDRILPHDTLIFATPIYWYSMSGTMKNFVDRWSHMMRDANYPEFKKTMSAKKAYVITVGGDNPTIKGLPLIQQFQNIFEFMGMTFEGYIIGTGNKPEEILQDKVALFAAVQLQEKLQAL